MRRLGVNVILVSALFLFSTLVTPASAEPSEAANDASYELIASKAVKLARVTGASQDGETIPNPNVTHATYGVHATDLGIIWDATTDPNDRKVMAVFGDTFGEGWVGSGGGGGQWRSNVLAISRDTDLSDGMTFSSMITDPANSNYAKEVISSAHNTSGSGDFTAIPTAGITVGARHYIHYMQIKNWGANGRWNTNFSEIAYSDDEGQTWTKSGVRWGAASNFAQAAFVKDGGYVYMFGTKAGRFDAAYLARVPESDVLAIGSYEYWDGAAWVKDEAAAAAVVEAPISELSVQYNSYYKKWIMLYLNEDRAAIVLRSSSSLTGGWSGEVEVAKGTEFPALYGSFIHPWTNDGKDLYFVMSQWIPYNVFMMHATLDIGDPAENLIADPSFERQTSNTISAPWILESGNGGIDRGISTSRAGKNNVYLRNASGWNGIKQDVAVKPNTEYQLMAFVRTSQSNNAGYFGVRAPDGTIMKETKFERHDQYSPLTVRFNSGDHSSVTVFTGMWPNGDTWVQADNYYLLEVDMTPPVLTLQGDPEIEIPLGGTFVEPGATATDAEDGDLTHKIIVDGSVNPNLVGTDTLTYHVTDADGNNAIPVTRTVTVVGEQFTVGDVTVRGADGTEIAELPKKGLIAASADIRNNTRTDRSVTLVVALFNKKGEIENFSSATKAIPSGMTETFTGGFMLPGNNSGYSLQVFLSDSPTGTEPISTITVLE